MYIFVYTHVWKDANTHIPMLICIQTLYSAAVNSVCEFIYIYIYIYIYIHIYRCMGVCMYVCIHTHMGTCKRIHIYADLHAHLVQRSR
jgi:hypothetical protein